MMIAGKYLQEFFNTRYRDEGWNWMDLRKTANQVWLAKGFPMNDHEFANAGPKAVHSSDYVDMTSLGNKLEFRPNFASNATDGEKSGKRLLCTFFKYMMPFNALRLYKYFKFAGSRMSWFDVNGCLRSDIRRCMSI